MAHLLCRGPLTGAVFRTVHLNFCSSRGAAHSAMIEKGYINGKFVDAHDGKTYAVLNPSTNEVIGVSPDMGENETLEAIKCARTAFESFKDTLAKDRSAMLEKMRNNLITNADEYAKVLTFENGKPFVEAKGEILYSASYFDWFAGEARRIYGDVAPASMPNRRLVFIKQPVGVVGCITPWNFPSSMLARKISAAIAVGCTVVAKPAEDTPFSSLILAKIADEAGVPPGVFNIVTSTREKVGLIGKTLCESTLVSKISFTGSTPVGRALLKQGSYTLKHFSGELGGNAPFIVFDSAKLDDAVAGAMVSKFRGSGQTCICANRIFVQEGIYDAFAKALKDRVENLVVGDGFNPDVTQGPLINKQAIDKVSELVGDAVKKGAEPVCGGTVHPKLKGNFFEPTILARVGPEMRIFHEEIFGPVAVLVKFKTEDEVIHLANDTRAGLASYFYSQDYSQVWRVAEKLEYGMVGINEGAISSAEIPFGGVKESGMGREGSKYGVDDYLNVKFMCFGNVLPK